MWSRARCTVHHREHARNERLESVHEAENVRADGRLPHVEIGIDQPIGAGAAGVEERDVDTRNASYAASASRDS